MIKKFYVFTKPRPEVDLPTTLIQRKNMLSLFSIEDVFDITGRGCVLASGIPHSLGLDLKIGARIVIVSPSGGHIYTQISSFEMLHMRATGLSHAPVAVPPEIGKEQLELGSQVFLLEENGI